MIVAGPPSRQALRNGAVREVDAVRIDEDDPRVIAALEDYARVVEEGGNPDRAAFLHKHAEIASTLAAGLEGVEFLRRATREVRDDDSTTLSPLCRDRPRHALDGLKEVSLVDFHLLHEIGRGGMGVVYEAEQLSTRRRVAVKVLPYAASLDRRQRLRFRAEALAAAHLQHPNIVPVLGIGDEMGIPFYVMELVQGTSLSAWIRRHRAGTASPDLRGWDDPTEDARRVPFGIEPGGEDHWRFVAHVGEHAALALDHAHQLGIIHRDIKPGNLLVDGEGRTHITDFGLARLPVDLGLTITGDLLGTLRYMSPEQARGRGADLDGRTDLFALGATLYELLTFRPAFDGRDAAEVLNQILQREPIPPRRIHTSIPRPLETIVLKALGKEPAARYASARDLAEDLRRFQRGEIIAARRPGVFHRVRDLSRRHRRLAVRVGGIAVFGATLAASGTALVTVERRLESTVEREDATRRRADQSLEITLRALETLVREAGEPATAGGSWSRPEGERLLLAALSSYQQLAVANGPDTAASPAAAVATARSGDLHVALGHPDEARRAYLEASERFRQLLEVNPEVLKHRLELSVVLNNLGILFKDLGQAAEAEGPLRRSLALVRELGERYPMAAPLREQIAVRENNLGVVLTALGRAKEAESTFREAIVLRESLLNDNPAGRDSVRQDLAVSLSNLAGLLRAENRLDDAERLCQRAIDIQRGLLAANPEDSILRRDLGRTWYNLSLVHAATRSILPAELAARQALDLQTRLADEFASRHELREDLALTRCSLAHVHAATGRFDEAESSFRCAAELREGLVRQEPGITNYRRRLGSTYVELALLYGETGRIDESLEAYRKALAYRPDDPIIHNNLAWALATSRLPSPEEAEEAVRLARRSVASRPDEGGMWNTLGVACYRAGDWSGAVKALAKSMRLRTGGDSYDWFFLAMIASQRGHPEEAQAWFRRAERWFTRNEGWALDLGAIRSEARLALAESTASESAGFAFSESGFASPGSSTHPDPVGEVNAPGGSTSSAGPGRSVTEAAVTAPAGRGPWSRPVLGPTSITLQTLQRSTSARAIGG